MSESAKPFHPTSKQIACIILSRRESLGDVTLFDLRVGGLTKSKTAYVSGTRFTAGEPPEGRVSTGWDCKRCGSVFTTVVDGVSRYDSDISE